MGSAAPEAVRAQIAGGSLDPVYLILSDDEQWKLALAAEFEQALDEGLRAFNLARFHGGEAALGEVLDAARTLPLMAPRRVVIVSHAERLLQPSREGAATARDAAELEAYLEDPLPHAALVFVSAPLDERRRLNKQLLRSATVVRSAAIQTVADAQRWIRTRLQSAGKRVEPEAVRLLGERIGPNPNRLRDETERLLLYVGEQAAVSLQDAREVAGPAAAYDNWAVTRAIERGDTATALRQLDLALEQGAEPYMVLGQLAWVARSRLPAPRIPGAIDVVFRTDAALKRAAGDRLLLLERLVVELCAAAAGGRGGSGLRGRAGQAP
ncbi:MAG: DNA polymerase III subunit delta [Acidobacteria bacterium]|nr:DNA polymerase III subunit delta [Acidobacteriota bacterium]